jgi:hypothetical protein
VLVKGHTLHDWNAEETDPAALQKIFWGAKDRAKLPLCGDPEQALDKFGLPCGIISS